MSSLEQLYQQVILDHARAKNGRGESPQSLAAASHQVNPTCGDEVTLGVTVDGDHIADLRWDGDGCSISQASLSILHDLVEGASLEQVTSMYAAMDQMMHSRGHGVPDATLDLLEDGAALEGTSKFPNRIKCALLGWYALRDSLAQLGTDIAEEHS